MTGGLSEFHEELRAVARKIVGRPPSALGGLEPQILDWGALADAGLLGLEVPEGLGGAGATFAEVAVVLHELGRAPGVGPYLGSTVLATAALLLSDPGPARDELLAELAVGTKMATLVLDARTTRWDGPTFSVAPTANGATVAGRAEWVLDAAGADRLLCPAQGASGPVLVEVANTGDGLVVEDRPLADGTRRVGSVAAEGSPVLAGWPLPPGAVDDLVDLAATAVACDSLGLMEAMLEATVAFAKVRHQFGRPIGSFQAVQHACADMLVTVEVSRALVAQAVDAVASDTPAEERRASVSRAKSHVGAAAVEVCGKAVQLHGGIGYTWESGIHAYLKRATLNRALFGSPIEHRRRLVRALPGSPPC